MSRCKDFIQRFVENPESIRDEAGQSHLAECPECRALFTIIEKGTGKDTVEDVQELTQKERNELLTLIRRQEQLLIEKVLPQKNMFFFKPKFVMAIAGIIIIVASWISLPHIFQERKQETRVTQKAPESRKMKLVIESDSGSRMYLEIEYFPENESNGGTYNEMENRYCMFNDYLTLHTSCLVR